MAEVHERVLQILREQWPGREEDSYRCFYLRRTRDELFEKGYWFPGDEDRLILTFWTGNDTKKKAPNAYLELHRTKGCRAILTATDSKLKAAFFTEARREFLNWLKQHPEASKFIALASTVRSGSSELVPPYAADDATGQLSRNIAPTISDYEYALRAYLQLDKPALDASIRERLERKELIAGEFELPFGFISPNEFEDSLSQVLQQQVLLVEKQRERRALIQGLGIRLLGFQISRFMGIRQTEVRDLPADTRWIFLTGDNGFGKTSVLRALAAVLGGYAPLDKRLEAEGQLTTYLWQNNAERVIVKSVRGSLSDRLGKRRGVDDIDDYLVAYGATRLNRQARDDQNGDKEMGGNVNSIFNGEARLKNFDYEFVLANGYDDEKFEFLQEALFIASAKRIEGVAVKQKGEEVLYLEVVEEGKKPVETTYDNLATGFRSIINMVADIYIRLAKAQGARHPHELVGIVIIDELENHLHPKLQKTLPDALSKVFPKLQFIASTHSPIPFLGAPKESVFLRVNRSADPEVGITVEQEDVDVSVLLPNTILSSPLFGFQNLSATSRPPDKSVRVEKTYQDLLQTDKEQREVSSFLDEENTQKLLALLQRPNLPA